MVKRKPPNICQRTSGRVVRHVAGEGGRDKAERGQRVREYSAFDLKEITITGTPSFKAGTVAHATPTPARDEHARQLQSHRVAGFGL